MSPSVFDYIVIGGGSGGIASARRAASHGAKVALIERADLGGTCVNVGCVPKKLMFTATGVKKTIQVASDFGLDVHFKGLDWSRLKDRRDAAILRLRGIYEQGLSSAQIHTVRGSARFVDARTAEVGSVRYQAPHILIATGSCPRVLSIPGANLAGTSDDFFKLERQPAKVAIVGSGYVAVELGSTLIGLGSQVTMFIRGSHVLRYFDSMLGQVVQSELCKDGLAVEGNARVSALKKAADGLIELCLESGKSFGGFDWVLWAIGRDPVIQGLNLAAAGIEIPPGGQLQVDDFQNTSAPGIYALGDVTERFMLTPVAIGAGRKLADRLFGAKPQSKLDYENIPSVVFSHPPIGTVGLSEVEACVRFGAESIRVYESRFTNLYYAMCQDRRPTQIKLVTHLPDERVLGVHVVGLGADELIQGFAVAVKMGATKADFDGTVAIHPTAAEELVTMTRHRPGRVD